MENFYNPRVEAEAQYASRTAGEILQDYLENSNEPLVLAHRERSAEAAKQGWKSNTDLGCDVKTILRSDRRMKVGKEYQGIFRLDAEAVVDEFLCRDAHYTFVEAALATSPQRRNVHLYEGRHITCTCSPDGMLRLNFKQLKPETLSNVGGYALEVANEIQEALRGLVEEV